MRYEIKAILNLPGVQRVKRITLSSFERRDVGYRQAAFSNQIDDATRKHLLNDAINE